LAYSGFHRANTGAALMTAYNTPNIPAMTVSWVGMRISCFSWLGSGKWQEAARAAA
jgi:hypothetical protein